ncbi:MAG: radical SAM protein, partial [Dehalococcoidia bacterium]
MIDLSGLYCGDVREADLVEAPGGKTVEDPRHLRFSGKWRPVVVWNSTRTCNLACVHCYTDSTNVCYKGELTTEEGKALIDDLAAYGVPVLLFSGGEPLVRGDIFTLASHAASRGLRPALSTNGTMIDS